MLPILLFFLLGAFILATTYIPEEQERYFAKGRTMDDLNSVRRGLRIYLLILAVLSVFTIF